MNVCKELVNCFKKGTCYKGHYVASDLSIELFLIDCGKQSGNYFGQGVNPAFFRGVAGTLLLQNYWDIS